KARTADAAGSFQFGLRLGERQHEPLACRWMRQPPSLESKDVRSIPIERGVYHRKAVTKKNHAYYSTTISCSVAGRICRMAGFGCSRPGSVGVVSNGGACGGDAGRCGL